MHFKNEYYYYMQAVKNSALENESCVKYAQKMYSIV